MIRFGRRSLRTARTRLTELCLNLRYLCGESSKLLLVTDDGHLQDGVVHFWLCLSWHLSSLPLSNVEFGLP